MGGSLPPDCFVSRGRISPYGVILNIFFLGRGVVSTSSNPQAGGPPLVGYPRLLIQFIHSYPPYWRPFLHPQPEDAPCRGDRDPHFNYIENAMSRISVTEISEVILPLPRSPLLHYFKMTNTAIIITNTTLKMVHNFQKRHRQHYLQGSHSSQDGGA